MAFHLRVFANRLRALFGQRRADGEFDGEIDTHLQLLAERFVGQGMSAHEAAAAARRQFGNTTLLHQRRRESRTFLSFSTLQRDLRFSIRQLRRSPSLTIIAIVSLGLGIGANTAIFSVAKKVLFDTLPVKNPHELRLVTWVSGHEQPVPPVWGDVSATESGGLTSNAFSYPVLQTLRQRTDVFAEMIAFKDVPLTATIDGAPELISGEMVSGSAFETLGVRPALGRTFTLVEDSSVGRGAVAVLSERYWAKRFGRSAAVVGKTISLNGVPVTVVGVSSAGFSGLQFGSMTQVFVPITMQPILVPRAQSGSVSLLDNPQSWWVQILVRLRPDVPEARAQAVLDVVLRQATTASLPASKAMDQLHLRLQPGDRGLDYLRGDFARPSYVLLALAGLVLLLACVNLANLLLARAATRQREMSTRLALGAGRTRILRQVLTESLLLSCMGGAAGLLLGFLGRNIIPRLLAKSSNSATMQVDFDWRVLAFTIAVSFATGILFGAIPAWQAMHAEVSTALKDAGHVTRSRSGTWLGKGLVVFQIALSAILLIGAGLFVRTLLNLSHTPLGFREDHILMFQLNPPRARYSDTQMIALYRQLEERLAAVPGVLSMSMSNIAIIGDGHSGSTFHVSGSPREKEAVRVQTNCVGSDFFATMGIPILKGRGFNSSDTTTSPKVAVVNSALARKFFPNQDPIGRIFEADADDVEEPIQIVGLAPDTRYADLRSETPPTFYLLYLQQRHVSRMVFEVRTAAEPGSVLTQIRSTVSALNRDLPLIDVRTMKEQVASTMSAERTFARLTSGFAILALVLACIGIYGIMAYNVARRTSEIGIRMALGAKGSQVLTMILRDVSWMAAAGLALGIGGAWWLTRFVSTMLYGLSPTDPPTLISVAVLLILVALLAGLGPAHRASRVDPTRALRHE